MFDITLEITAEGLQSIYKLAIGKKHAYPFKYCSI